MPCMKCYTPTNRRSTNRTWQFGGGHVVFCCHCPKVRPITCSESTPRATCCGTCRAKHRGQLCVFLCGLRQHRELPPVFPAARGVPCIRKQAPQGLRVFGRGSRIRADGPGARSSSPVLAQNSPPDCFAGASRRRSNPSGYESALRITRTSRFALRGNPPGGTPASPRPRSAHRGCSR